VTVTPETTYSITLSATVHPGMVHLGPEEVGPVVGLAVGDLTGAVGALTGAVGILVGAGTGLGGGGVEVEGMEESCTFFLAVNDTAGKTRNRI